MSNETVTEAAETFEPHQPNPQAFLGNKVVNTDYISAMISIFPPDTKVPYTEFSIGSTLTFNANNATEATETQVVVVGYSVNSMGVLLNLAFRLSDDVFVIANDVFYVSPSLIKEPTEEE
jgi:hypothetical protein